MQNTGCDACDPIKAVKQPCSVYQEAAAPSNDFRIEHVEALAVNKTNMQWRW